MHKLIEVGAI